MDIKPPYGYQEIVPLTKKQRVVLPEGRKLPLVFRMTLAVVALVVSVLAALPLLHVLRSFRSGTRR